jgi:hypothetical protein
MRLELITYGLEGRCSIQLSYQGNPLKMRCKYIHYPLDIAPVSLANSVMN